MNNRQLFFAGLVAAAVWGTVSAACTQDFNQFETPTSSGQGADAASSGPGSPASSGSSVSSAASTSGSMAGSGGNGAGVGGGSSNSAGGGTSVSSSSAASTAVASSAASSTGGPVAVCGDGKKDPGEACDDGNTTPADGCSSTCEKENADACPGPAVPLTTAGFTIKGDTTGAANDTGELPCGGSASGDLVYAITPDQDGTLTASLAGNGFTPKLYARVDCPGMTGTNVACSPQGVPADITFDVMAGQVVYLYVDGSGPQAQEGTFTLTLSLQ